MATAATPAAPLDADLARFLTEGGVSMHASSCNAEGVSSLSRGLGCRVSKDRARVTVFLLASHSREMLADWRANGRIALVVTMPHSHRTVQLKGGDAAPEPLADGDRGLIAAYRAAFVKELAGIGYDPELPRLLVAGGDDDVVAVGFTVGAAFNQTPGPAAGQPVAR